MLNDDVPSDFVSLFGRTAFGFGHIWRWPQALQRMAFFMVASAGEFLTNARPLRALFGGLSQIVTFIVTLITPHAELDLNEEPERTHLRVAIIAAALAGMVISLFGNAVFTYLAGTFSGPDPRRLYYSQDYHNLFLYALVAPAYLAASVAIIYSAYSSFSMSATAASVGNSPHRAWMVARLAFVLSAIVLVAGLVQVNYFNENIMGLAASTSTTVTQACRDKIFWFIDDIPTAVGGRTVRLNSAGVYYLCMQFCHLAVIAAALWLIVTGMAALYRLGLRLTPAFLAANGGASPIRSKLAKFTLVEIYAKWLALILTIHIYVWGDSCLKGGHNIRVTAMFLLAFQFFVLATPRLLIEYKLLKCAALEPKPGRGEIEWPDLVDQRDKFMSSAVNSVHFIVQLALAVLIGKLVTIGLD